MDSRLYKPLTCSIVRFLKGPLEGQSKPRPKPGLVRTGRLPLGEAFAEYASHAQDARAE